VPRHKAAGRQQSEKQKKLAEKQVLVRQLEAIVKEQEEIVPGTGLKVEIQPLEGGGGNMSSEVAMPAAGNAANQQRMQRQ
jgi:hypothetical protein